MKTKPENTIEFSEKGITIYLTKAIYDAIEKVARTEYKDTRSVLGVEWLFQLMVIFFLAVLINKKNIFMEI